jgi:5-formyltetrahydrofolate cyclo-ligase
MNPDKAALRLEALARRQGLPPAGEAIARNFLDGVPWQAARVISGYLPMGDEADLLPLMRLLADKMALPVVTGRAVPLTFRRWKPGDRLEKGVFGTFHPPPAVSEVEPDLLLVPLLAFDESGHRLGYGGGYYDRTLAGLRHRRSIVAVGVGFEAQLFPKLPFGSHDQRLDFMVTEKKVREFKA